MKVTLKTFALAAALAIATGSVSVFAQQATPSPQPEKRVTQQSSGPQSGPQSKPSVPRRDGLEPDDRTTLPTDVPADVQGRRVEQMSEDEALVARYYNNFFNNYRLGPEDMISVLVFGQERYSKAGIVIPPSGRISYPLIPEGVLVNGKTVEEVQEILKKRLDEYIINPEVSVSLDRPGSYKYAVLGDVSQPGVKPMTSRLSAYEAIVEAGGILNTGSKKNVFILRRQASGVLAKIPVNISAIEKGRAADMTYLVPGDQIFVPGNTLKKVQQVLQWSWVLNFARLFTFGAF